MPSLALDPQRLIALLASDAPRPGSARGWLDIIGSANQTLTTPLLADRLAAHDGVPADARLFLTLTQDANVERNKRLAAQLNEIVAALAPVAATPILIKGAALLAMRDRGRSSGRIMSDLDLMLPAAAIRPAVDRLMGDGYAVFRRDAGDTAPAVLFRDCDVGMVDLHSRMKSAVPRLTYETIRPFCRPVRMEGGEVVIPSPTLQIAVLVSHDQLQELDYWRGLIDVRHLADMAALARDSEGIDWPLLNALFAGRTAQSALRTQLVCLHRLFGIDVPHRWRRGLMPQLQYRRRLLQMRWPMLRWSLTLITLALAGMPAFVVDMVNGSAKDSTDPRLRPLATVRRALVRTLRRRAVGKLG